MIDGCVLSYIKIAKIMPLYKGKEQHFLCHYRPILILPSLSKIIEKVIHNRLTSFPKRNNILSETQFGFRSGHSTCDAFIKYITDLLNDKENKLNHIAVFLDLSKAFDTIDHVLLLDKLEFYGTRGKALDWFRSYLLNRKQYVNFNNCLSNMNLIKCGIPQGYV